jgi:hypothetical protein
MMPMAQFSTLTSESKTQITSLDIRSKLCIFKPRPKRMDHYLENKIEYLGQEVYPLKVEVANIVRRLAFNLSVLGDEKHCANQFNPGKD